MVPLASSSEGYSGVWHIGMREEMQGGSVRQIWQVWSEKVIHRHGVLAFLNLSG